MKPTQRPPPRWVRALRLTALALGLALLLLRIDADRGEGARQVAIAPAVYSTGSSIPIGALVREGRVPALTSAAAKPLATIDLRAPRTEREHRERFLARLRASPTERAALEAEAPSLLLASDSKAEQVGLLRAFEQAGAARCDELYQLALLELPCESGAASNSLPDYALRRLGRRMERDPELWSSLYTAVRGTEARLDPSLRGRALALLVVHASDHELPQIESEVGASAPGLARDMGSAAIRERRARDANPLQAIEEEAP